MTQADVYEITRQDTYPGAYPSGWYHVLDADALRPGDVRELRALGKHLVAFRGRESGVVSVLDAHCLHQGANLAGGDVQGDCIRCPFHNWSFAGDGCLRSIPGLDKVPRARLRSYPVREHYGMLWMYHDVTGEVAEPPYEPPALPDIDDGTLRPRGTYAPRDARMHICEFIENSVDFQHFAHLHSELTIPWTQIKIPGFGVHYEPGWELDPELEHVAYFLTYAYLVFRGRHYRKSGASVRVTLLGPGSTVWFRFTLPELGDIVMFQTHLPTAPLNQRVRFRWYADRRIPRPLVWYVVGHWISQWRADVEIWENKIMRPRPVLVSLDGPVHKMRRWVKQFYEPAPAA
ncbi:MAG: Rieske 2Fe-2S domain-containing protein [Myxococcales bacterium]|nr:Rieske 2Fe-2S domain-containing protein [Myxococcales bacterium]MCB9753006.1 Rieske 2Fe-2S domain-containing protein [Myxococcales bacterium]